MSPVNTTLERFKTLTHNYPQNPERPKALKPLNPLKALNRSEPGSSLGSDPAARRLNPGSTARRPEKAQGLGFGVSGLRFRV